VRRAIRTLKRFDGVVEQATEQELAEADAEAEVWNNADLRAMLITDPQPYNHVEADAEIGYFDIVIA